MIFVMVIPVFIFPTNVTAEAPVLTPIKENQVTGIEKLGKGLQDLISNDDNKFIDIIMEIDGGYYGNIVSTVDRINGNVNKRFNNADLVTATIPAGELMKVALNEHVKRIYKDDIIKLADDTNLKGDDTLYSLDMAGVVAIDQFEMKDINPNMHLNAFLTDAPSIWAETQAGAGTVIAVIDTGIKPHVVLGDRVIGGVDLTSDVGTIYEGFDNLYNINHGTFVSSQAAGNAIITFAANSSTGDAFLKYDPYAILNSDGSVSVYLLGTAPLASLYGIKVFSAYGSTSTSTILAGIDHAITMDVDVINLSLGGATYVPGEDLMDLMVDAATAVGIAVTISAGNSGPNPLQVGSPGTAISAITVGAASTPSQERIYGDFIYGDGLSYYSHDKNSIAYFSSRGPTSDGRMKPDVVATGSHNLGASGTTGLSFGSGTSYAAPVVAGAAALLASYSSLNNIEFDIKEALKAGAVPIPGFEQFEQGMGYINLVNSMDYINSHNGHHHGGYHHKRDHHKSSLVSKNVDDVLTISKAKDGVISFSDVVIAPSEFSYYSFMVSEDTDFIRVSVNGVSFDDNNDYFGDRGWGYLSTAKAIGLDNNYLDVSSISVGDNLLYGYSDFKFEEGLIRFTIENDFISFGNMHIDSISIEIVEASLTSKCNGVEIKNEGVATYGYFDVYAGEVFSIDNSIVTDQVDYYTFEITDTNGLAIFELSWDRTYKYYGTTDLDVYVFDEFGNLVAYGAGSNSVEYDAFGDAGIYTIVVVGYYVYDMDGYSLDIFYFSNPNSGPIYSSDLLILAQDEEYDIDLPNDVHGTMIFGTLNEITLYGNIYYIDVWADFAQV